MSIRHKNTLVASYSPLTTGVKTITGLIVGKPAIMIYAAYLNTTLQNPGWYTIISFTEGVKNAGTWLGIGAGNLPHGGGSDIVFVPTATTVKFQVVSSQDNPSDDALYVYA